MIRGLYRILRGWLRALRRRLPIRPLHAGALRVFSEPDPAPELALWQSLVVRGLLEVGAEQPLDILVGSVRAPRDLAARSLRLEFQPEHLLVKPGGRDSSGSPSGSTLISGTDTPYLFRLSQAERLAKADLILDYSACNLEHWRTSGHALDLHRRARCLAPLVLSERTDRGTRHRDIITMFADPDQPRRRRWLDEARIRGVPVRNERGAFDAVALTALLDDTRVLVNMRQTDHHDTAEELRLLPAIQRRVVVVSEDVPLRTLIPYHRFILWCQRDDLLATAERALADWPSVWDQLYGDDAVSACLAEMADANRLVLARALATKPWPLA